MTEGTISLSHTARPKPGGQRHSIPRTRNLASRARAHGFRKPIACVFKRANSESHPLRLGRTVAKRSRRRFCSTAGGTISSSHNTARRRVASATRYPERGFLASRARAYGFRTLIKCAFKQTNSEPHPLPLGRTVALQSRRRFSRIVGSRRLRQRAQPRVRRPALLNALNEPGASTTAP